MITVTNTENVLKDYYLDVVTSQLNGEISPFYNAIAKTSENVFGKQVKLGIVKRGMGTVKACDENATLPTAGSNRYYYINQPLKNIYGTIELTDKVIRASSDSSGSLINMLNAEMTGLITDAKSTLARMLYGNEDGKLTTVVRKVSNYVFEVEDVKPFYVNCDVSIQYGSVEIPLTITNVDTEAKTITIDRNLSDYSFAGGEYVMLYNMWKKELKGLAYIFDNDSIYGYSKATTPYFKPYDTTISRGDLCEDDLVKIIDEIEEANGSKINMILCSFSTRRLIAKLFESNKQIVNTTDIQAGCTNIFVNTVPVYADAFCPDGRIYFVNSDDFVLCQLCDWSWLEDENGRVLKQVAGKAAFSATLVKYAELICKRPCGQGLIRLTD